MSPDRTTLSIRTKTTLFVVFTVGVLTALMVAVQFRTSLSRVQQIEDDQAVEQADRVVRQLQNSLADVGGTNTDWAWWDDSHEFVQDGNQEYRDTNVYAEAFTPIGIDLVAFVDTGGAVVHQAWFVDDDEVAVPEALLALTRPGAPLADFDDPRATPGGLVQTGDHVFLVTSRAILPSDQTGAPAGVLLMARDINEAFVAEFAQLVNLDLMIEPCDGEICAALTAVPRISKNSDSIATDTAIAAIDGSPVLRTRIDARRTMYRESLDGIQRVLFVLVVVGLAAIVITIAGLRRLVIVPLERLGTTVADVARTNDPSLRAPVDRHDEIGHLAGGLNVMLARLENAQQQLVEARQRVEGASEAKSRFLSRVSHELRTPINGVLAYAQLLQLDHPDGDSGESIDQIITSARHITTLVDEFLDIARIEAGAIPINIGAVDATAIAHEVIDMTQPLADVQGTRIDLIGLDDTTVLADPLRLRQSILNLVSNAIKYGQGEDPITITVRHDGPLVALEVRDHGKGIPASQLDRLFVPFDRLDADSTDHKGSGVGLSVTKQLVNLMHGTIDVTSEVGAGTTFTINLPAPTDCEDPPESGADNGASDTTEVAPTGPKVGIA